ncbi:hypothetical protein BJY52DRAFT_770711 [Lactarius psammicola]|nr:hypothetical protein BJY52DRAFT_770711 [Lactarius psammicola]
MCNAIWLISNALNQDHHHPRLNETKVDFCCFFFVSLSPFVLSSTYSSLPVPLLAYDLISGALNRTLDRRTSYLLSSAFRATRHPIAQSTLPTPKLTNIQRAIYIPRSTVPVSDLSACHPCRLCWAASKSLSPFLTLAASPVFVVCAMLHCFDNADDATATAQVTSKLFYLRQLRWRIPLPMRISPKPEPAASLSMLLRLSSGPGLTLSVITPRSLNRYRLMRVG